MDSHLIIRTSYPAKLHEGEGARVYLFRGQRFFATQPDHEVLTLRLGEQFPEPFAKVAQGFIQT